MNIAEYRERRIENRDLLVSFSLDGMRLALALARTNPAAARGVPAGGLYGEALLSGSCAINHAAEEFFPDLSRQSRIDTQPISLGEISLSGIANLFACCGREDLSPLFKERLRSLRTSARGGSVDRQWHFSRAFAGVALGVRALYRDAAAADCELDELMPFSPRILYGNNPQALLAHLAAGAENHVAIEDVWPAFRECVHNFPYHEEVGDFDGACLFWIARIVHHQIGGGPLGQTADWLSKHFNAWADGRELPPMGGAP